MGWSYRYILLEMSDSERDKIRDNAIKDDFKDYTKIVIESDKFDKKNLKKFSDIISKKVNQGEIRTVFEEKPEQKDVAEYYTRRFKEDIYELRFIKLKENLYMYLWFGCRSIDINNYFFKFAIYFLYKYGYRGKLIDINANSVCDDAQIIEHFISNKISLCVKDMKSGEGEYHSFLEKHNKWWIHRILIKGYKLDTNSLVLVNLKLLENVNKK